MALSMAELIRKYDIQAPRYTSYPTVPYWSDSPTTDQWIDELKKAYALPKMTWSMYLHIPFCETLCTFCGCNTSITKDHSKEQPYVALLLKEFGLYQERVPEIAKRQLVQIHLGGGTPTFLSAKHLVDLLEPILRQSSIDRKDFEGSIEVDPRRTTFDQLKVLKDIGFNRVSMGVQDFNPEVQRLVNRIQPREVTEKLTAEARRLGYESVNFDLIYGLPGQTRESIEVMARATVDMKPDRIALYSFALVPWIKPAQRLFKDEDLPAGQAKRELYERSREILIAGGYREIGMDHFALPTDALSRSDRDGTLHRNFMGYADRRTEVLLGLGISSISETPTCFHQNEKVHPVYERRVQNGEIPTFRGHLLSADDVRHREQILKFMTTWEVRLEDQNQLDDVRNLLSSMIEDGLVKIEKNVLKLTDQGRPFLRNACMALDQRMRRQQPNTKVFSQAI